MSITIEGFNPMKENSSLNRISGVNVLVLTTIVRLAPGTLNFNFAIAFSLIPGFELVDFRKDSLVGDSSWSALLRLLLSYLPISSPLPAPSIPCIYQIVLGC